jgi:hypothetical protein
MGAVIAWRLPEPVNALATLLPGLSRPLRAAFAAVAMRTIWVVAYILGFSQVAW